MGVNKYQILALGENELYLMSGQKGVPGNGWFYRLVPKGYTRPVEARQVKAIELEDNFDTDGNVTWKKETLTLNENYDNPAPVPINDSPKVAMYVKQAGQAYEFANMFADYAYNFDLTQKSVIKL
ncbi:MAG: hypothetical protein LPK03_13820, partial [Pontibacter sp.]|nr:hypothetical protein [Pontibacter sp.]